MKIGHSILRLLPISGIYVNFWVRKLKKHHWNSILVLTFSLHCVKAYIHICSVPWTWWLCHKIMCANYLCSTVQFALWFARYTTQVCKLTAHMHNPFSRLKYWITDHSFCTQSEAQKFKSTCTREYCPLGTARFQIGQNLHFNPFRMKTPNIYSQEEINLYCIIKLATSISLFSLQINKTWCFV